MVAAAFIPRLNSGSCPTSWKFSDVPGVPPPGPTVTPSRCGTAPLDAAAAGAAVSSARETSKDSAAGRRLIVRTSLYRTSPHAITARQPAEGRVLAPQVPVPGPSYRAAASQLRPAAGPAWPHAGPAAAVRALIPARSVR